MYPEKNADWDFIIIRRGKLTLAKPDSAPNFFNSNVRTEHTCNENCHRFDSGDVLGIDWIPKYSMWEILEGQSFEDLNNEVQQFLVGVAAMNLAADAKASARTRLILQ